MFARHLVVALLLAALTRPAGIALAHHGANEIELIGDVWDHAEVSVAVDRDVGDRDMWLDAVEQAIRVWNDLLGSSDVGGLRFKLVGGQRAEVIVDLRRFTLLSVGSAQPFTKTRDGCTLRGVAVRVGTGALDKLSFRRFTPDSIRTIALHELGHALGLAHAHKPSDLMYPSLTQIPNGPSDLDRKALETAYEWLDEGRGVRCPGEGQVVRE
jgi:hypothetical protein